MCRRSRPREPLTLSAHPASNVIPVPSTVRVLLVRVLMAAATLSASTLSVFDTRSAPGLQTAARLPDPDTGSDRPSPCCFTPPGEVIRKILKSSLRCIVYDDECGTDRGVRGIAVDGPPRRRRKRVLQCRSVDEPGLVPRFELQRHRLSI